MIETYTYQVSVVFCRIILYILRGTAEPNLYIDHSTYIFFVYPSTPSQNSLTAVDDDVGIFAFYVDLSVIMQKRKLCCQQSFHIFVFS